MFNSYQYSGSYDDLLKLMTRHAQENEVDNQIFDILKQFFEKELGKEGKPGVFASRKNTPVSAGYKKNID